MENIKSEQNDKFKAKVKRILYPESNSSSSDDDSLSNTKLLDQRQPITDRCKLDDDVEILRRHEEFITKQLHAVIKMRQRGILAVSSKQSNDDLMENDGVNSDGVKEQPSGEGSSSRGKALAYNVSNLKSSTDHASLLIP